MVEVGDLNPGAEKCLGWTSTVLFLATFAVALRFWSRLKGRKVGADDWTILAGLALNWCFSVETLVGCSVGLAGFHLTQLTVPQIELNLKVQLLPFHAERFDVESFGRYNMPIKCYTQSPWPWSNFPFFCYTGGFSRLPNFSARPL